MECLMVFILTFLKINWAKSFKEGKINKLTSPSKHKKSSMKTNKSNN